MGKKLSGVSDHPRNAAKGPLRAENERLKRTIADIEQHRSSSDRGGVSGDIKQRHGSERGSDERDLVIQMLQEQLLEGYAAQHGAAASSCVVDVIRSICQGCTGGEASLVLCAQAAVGAAMAADACR